MTASAIHRTSRTLTIGNVTLGGPEFSVIAGPCSLESLDQFLGIADGVKSRGASMLRGGIFKLRTRPTAFQGLGPAAYGLAREVCERTEMPLVTEITDPRQIDSLGEVAHCFQVGARNMYNYDLLKELGRTRKPVLLKRAFSATIDEWLNAAEYVTGAGNPNVALCERGIRTFERATRNTLDLSAVAYIKSRTDYPVIVDPSHGTGVRDLIPAMCLAAAAAGADGLLLEVHDTPAEALSDGEQALTLEDFGHVMGGLERLLPALGRTLQKPHSGKPAGREIPAPEPILFQ